VVYTTTEPAEALMLGGNIVVMDKGRLLQAGPTPKVYRRPASMRVAEIFSDPPINFIQAQVHEKQVRLGDTICLPLNGHMAHLSSGPYILGIRCNHLLLRPSSPSDVGLQAFVELCEINGSETFIHLNYENTRLVLQDDGVHQFKIGRQITVFVRPCQFFVYEPNGQLVASPA
jgi:glycerol transport system ATP-binding protein